MGDRVETRDRRQGQTGNDHAGNRTALESHGQTGCQAFFGGFGSAHIGDDRYAHTDVTGGVRGNGTHQEAQGSFDSDRPTFGRAITEQNDRENDRTCNKHAFELTIEVGNRAFLNGRGDLVHAFISGRRALYDSSSNDRIAYTEQTHQCAQ